MVSDWKRRFFTIWAGQACSLLGSMLVQFALVWWLTDRTGSATVLATAALFAMLPQILLTPIAGALVDRWNRRTVMIAADGLTALAAVGLALLFAADRVQPWHVYVIMCIRAAGTSFHWPAMQASTSLMVPPEHLTRVAGANQTLNGAMTIFTPPLGALLLDVLPVQGVLAIDVITAGLAILPLFFVDIPQPERRAAGGSSVRADLAAGLRYVWAWPGLRVLLVLAMAITCCLVPAFSLIAILVKDHFGGGALQVGWMQSAWGLGGVVGGVLLGVWGGFERRIATSMTGLIGMGFGLLAVGLVPGGALVPALVALWWAGSMMPLHGGPFYAAIQASVAPEMQGRVLALVNSLTSAVAPFSLLIAGPLADRVGVNIWYVLAGALCVIMGTGAFFIPALIGLDARPAAPGEAFASSGD